MATFSDRIYIGTNKETKNYEVINIITSGGSSWPTGAEYVIVISNSYNSFNVVHQETEKINIGDIVMFSGDFLRPSATKPVSAKFYSKDLASDKIVYQQGQTVVLPTPTRLGCNFLGWYDSEGNQVTSTPTVIDRLYEVYAKWEEKNPVTSIKVSEISDTYVTGDTYQIIASVTPTDAYFKNLVYTTSNKEIMTVTTAGLLTAVNAGKVTITVSDFMKKFTNTYEITVEMAPSIDIKFASDYNGVLSVGQSVQLEPTLVGSVGTGNLTYASSDTSVATVDATGKVTAVKAGDAKVTISYGTYKLEVGVTVDGTNDEYEVDKLIKLLQDNNFAVVDAGNVSLYNDGRERYYQVNYGSVNRYLFDVLDINEKYYATSENNPNNHKNRRAQDTVEFVCVHDTATLTGTSESIAQGMSSGETSIHYSVGNGKVWGVVPEKYIAYHAGDGTGSTFTWTNTGVKDTGSAPKFGVKAKGSGYIFTCNGQETSIPVPDCGGRVVSDALLTSLGPTWKVVDGNYYMGLMWWSSDYQKISSHGGNNNSIGIEMSVNTSNDMYDTWQRTAKLVSDIVIRNNLDLTRIYQHNTFSGKNCPQDILAGNIWKRFMQLVEVEYTIATQYKDFTITMKSNDPGIVNNTGRVIKAPLTTTTVSYDVTVTHGTTTKTVKLYSVIPGSTTWEQWYGTYSVSTIWNNGEFCKY